VPLRLGGHSKRASREQLNLAATSNCTTHGHFKLYQSGLG